MVDEFLDGVPGLRLAREQILGRGRSGSTPNTEGSYIRPLTSISVSSNSMRRAGRRASRRSTPAGRARSSRSDNSLAS
ncbi:hypothetical protein [Candidatus Frankia nodulisporulans]|uniref:hypothetical protein n=1 Tax=Candidatus Frankia nodulisporulans TaxID=2060052 RepID=UPI0013D605D4|nr:hypothetical protein [Candidatus Frankia nodulisporulans]